MATETAAELQTAVDETVALFTYDDEQLRKSVTEFQALMDLGLSKKGEQMSMIPTYVTELPDGSEKGTYLAIDLGGTNLRVCSVELLGHSQYKTVQEKTAVPHDIMTAQDPARLFGYIADQLAAFVHKHHAEKSKCEHGSFSTAFTFSFPLEQTSISHGTILRWNKGFDIPAAIGLDVVDLLQVELDSRKVPVTVKALVSDTVGALLARSYITPDNVPTFIGAIFGTGTNGAYVEHVKNIKKMKVIEKADQMLINTEWGGALLPACPPNAYDVALDAESPNPGNNVYEKKISGMFLGELLRRVVVDYFTRGLLPGPMPAHISKVWSVDTVPLSEMAADSSDALDGVAAAMQKHLHVPASSLTLPMRQGLKRIAGAIGLRSARLSAVPIVAIMEYTERTQDAQVDIGLDGSVVEFYPNFIPLLRAAMRILNPRVEAILRIGPVKDGSSLGSAIAACLVDRMHSKGVHIE